MCCHKKSNGKVYIEEKFTFSLKMSISFFIFIRFFPWVFRNSWRLNWMKWVDEKRNSLLSIFNAFVSWIQCFSWNSFRIEFPMKWMKRQFDRLKCKTTHKKNINWSLLGFLLLNLYWIRIFLLYFFYWFDAVRLANKTRSLCITSQCLLLWTDQFRFRRIWKYEKYLDSSQTFNLSISILGVHYFSLFSIQSRFLYSRTELRFWQDDSRVFCFSFLYNIDLTEDCNVYESTGFEVTGSWIAKSCHLWLKSFLNLNGTVRKREEE